MAAAPRPGSDGWMRPLGATGIRVSAVCAGASPLGSMPGVYGHDVSADQGIATVLTLLSSPIRCIDTSNGYSGGESERRIGRAIAEAGGVPEGFAVLTKVDPRGRDYSGDRVRSSVAESQDRLGLEHLPLVHLHDPEGFDFSEMTAPGGPVDALVALRASGEVGAIGLAGGPVRQMARYLKLGVFDVLLVHNRWTLVDRSAGSLIGAALDQGMAVLNAAVYGGGILADREGALTTYGYRPAALATLEAIQGMRRVCAETGTDLATAALQFSLRDPRVASTVVGMSRPERVAATLSAVSADLPDALWDELESLVPPPEVWLDGPVGGRMP